MDALTPTYNGGNELTTRTEGSTTTTYSYDGNGNLTGSTGGPSLSYNGLGSIERKQFF